MKTPSVLAATVLVTASFAVGAVGTQPVVKQPVVKQPVLMTDAQMKEVIAGSNVGPGFGICTAVGKGHAPGAIKNFGDFANMNLPGNGNTNSKGLAPGFGQQTAGRGSAACADG